MSLLFDDTDLLESMDRIQENLNLEIEKVSKSTTKRSFNEENKLTQESELRPKKKIKTEPQTVLEPEPILELEPILEPEVNIFESILTENNIPEKNYNNKGKTIEKELKEKEANPSVLSNQQLKHSKNPSEKSQKIKKEVETQNSELQSDSSVINEEEIIHKTQLIIQTVNGSVPSQQKEVPIENIDEELIRKTQLIIQTVNGSVPSQNTEVPIENNLYYSSTSFGLYICNICEEDFDDIKQAKVHYSDFHQSDIEENIGKEKSSFQPKDIEEIIFKEKSNVQPKGILKSISKEKSNVQPKGIVKSISKEKSNVQPKDIEEIICKEKSSVQPKDIVKSISKEKSAIKVSNSDVTEENIFKRKSKVLVYNSNGQQSQTHIAINETRNPQKGESSKKKSKENILKSKNHFQEKWDKIVLQREEETKERKQKSLLENWNKIVSKSNFQQREITF
jgi:hypothetical protein